MTDKKPIPKSGAHPEIDSVMREAVAAVEEVERRNGVRRRIPVDDETFEESHGDDNSEAAEEAQGAAEAAALGDFELIERLEGEVASLKDISARAMADLDNYRKRAERERSELRRYALMEPLRQFLPVIDNLERALAAPGDAGDLRQGVEMIHRQMLDLLGSFQVSPVSAKGEPFDPKFHEAVSREESEEVDAPTVAAELQRGYSLHDRLLRPAMVTVAMPKSD